MMRHISSFFAAMLDRGAEIWHSRRITSGIAKVLVPTLLAGIGVFSSAMDKIGMSLPLIFLLPVYLLFGLMVCVWVIHAKKIRMPLSILPRRFRFPQEIRQPAKWVLPFLILMLAVSAESLRPNALRNERSLSGLLCNLQHEPVAHATVTAFDKFGRTSSANPESTDDDGYFFIDLDAFSQPPAELGITVGRCASFRIPVEARLLTMGSCRQGGPAARAGTGEKAWVMTCQG